MTRHVTVQHGRSALRITSIEDPGLRVNGLLVGPESFLALEGRTLVAAGPWPPRHLMPETVTDLYVPSAAFDRMVEGEADHG